MGNRTKRVRNARLHDRAPPANPDHAGNPSPLHATAASPGPHRHLHLGLVTMAKGAPSRRRHRPPKSPIKYATVVLGAPQNVPGRCSVWRGCPRMNKTKTAAMPAVRLASVQPAITKSGLSRKPPPIPESHDRDVSRRSAMAGRRRKGLPPVPTRRQRLLSEADEPGDGPGQIGPFPTGAA